MTISEKLAFEFIKAHDCFQFDTAVDRAKMTSYDIDKAFFVASNVEIYPFKRDPGYHTVYMVLPSVLNPKNASLADMLKSVQTKDLDVLDIIAQQPRSWQVTANRLKVLEQMMKNSGLIATKCEEYSFDPERIPKEDEEGKAIIPLTQNRLAEMDGVIIDGKKYYPAESIEHMCDEADKNYSKLHHDYEKLWRSIDPKFIDAHCRMMLLSKDLADKSLETATNLIDKLTEILKVSGK